jgi:hypothetical protein
MARGRGRPGGGVDPYEIFLTEPEGRRLDVFESPGVPGLDRRRERMVLRIRLLPAESGPVGWAALFLAG